MAEPITVEVVSPEAVLYSGEATMLITRTLEGGEVAFQAGHQAFLGALVENHTRVFQTDGTVQDIASPSRVRRGAREPDQGVDPVRHRRVVDRHRCRARPRKHSSATV